MFYIEMARDEEHGGPGWSFPNCVWAPTKTEKGSRWPFWGKVALVRLGDTIIHLSGVTPDAFFVGYSKAAGNGFETARRPPNPKSWNFSPTFYRADLTDYVPFHKPINLKKLFVERRAELLNYLEQRKDRNANALNIFYTWQSDRLQCLNGAYLSDADELLLQALFGGEISSLNSSVSAIISVETRRQLTSVMSRFGQDKFSAEVKKSYGFRCCFPGCNISDDRFLVAAHIARWADRESLRGMIGNGLCLCVFHDKAFELGLFTLNEHFKVFVNPNETSSVVQSLADWAGSQIKFGSVKPLEEALLEHWIRVDIDPQI